MDLFEAVVAMQMEEILPVCSDEKAAELNLEAWAFGKTVPGMQSFYPKAFEGQQVFGVFGESVHKYVTQSGNEYQIGCKPFPDSKFDWNSIECPDPM